ncbi:GPI ethanolamine phosphate transferase 1 [Plutella xylostella]|uniref:GPI ethanolamine phosphate transferase 1 n=1 Tax=Plutella xylostella TaxID=51655 RepID=UPI0020324B4A|nr:GPI ethanolamine phosphate transferase 1 [Plutella xylostella]
MFVIGFCIHIIFLFSIFDIYFKSPIVKNVPPYQPQHEAVADRLVLFVVDGLRAESFVNYTTMNYMRSVASSTGRWGISRTRVPTESRPGHVAVIAGFYEDPSAVAKGWKQNPVDFDSVFNQTKYTWCWGTYDILEIFTRGTVDDHIFTEEMDPYDQGFSTNKNTTLLDDWVFEHVKKFFEKARHDDSLRKKLHEKKIVFFLHLLGTDTSGHTHKPKSNDFLTTLRFVDEGIKVIEKIINDFYNDDGKTTFLMTSDHGMTDWGSHGAGDDHETETPYVLWGAGVEQIPVLPDDHQESLPFDNRLDINQADLTPLMATAISVPVPVNSIGQLPVDLLSMSLPDKAKAIYSNARQLASQYDKKRSDVEQDAIAVLYQPYEPLDKRKYNEIIDHTQKLLEEKSYEKVILLSNEIMHLSLSGLTYYHNYYQRPLLILVTFAFLGWIACLMKILLEQNIYSQMDSKFKRHRNMNFIHIFFIVLCFIAIYLVYEQSLPLQYYLFFLLPVIIWWYALTPISTWINFTAVLNKSRKLNLFIVELLCYTLGSLAMGLSFSYRWMLSLPLLGMALWPFFSSARIHLTYTLLFSWSISCLLLGAFTFMPVVGKDAFIELVVLAGLIWGLGFATFTSKILVRLYKRGLESKREILLSILQILLLGICLENVFVQSKRFENKSPVSYAYQTIAWVIALLSLVLPLLHSNRLLCRILAIDTSILTLYLLLSVSHEGLFLLTLIFNTICWILIEFKLAHSNKARIIDFTFGTEDGESLAKSQGLSAIERSVSHQDFRRAFFFLLYIIIAFFGTGNIASLNSFEVRWVTCFVTSFQPFLITGLVLLKTLAPFLCVGCCFRAVQHVTKAPTGYLHIIVLIYSNIMGIQLLYYVKNTGSWLEIGTSISQFVIVQVITLFIVLIHQIAKVLTDVSIYSIVRSISKLKGRKKYV